MITTYLGYKHLHICLATNNRLFTMNLSDTSKCPMCTSNREQTPLHMFYECDSVKPLFMWLLRVIYYLCWYEPESNIRFIYLDNKYSSTIQGKISNLFISSYILTIWRTRKENLRIGIMKSRILSKVTQTIDTIKQIPNISRKKDIGDCLDEIDFTDLLVK